MRSPDKSGALVKNARNAGLRYIKHRRLRKRSGVQSVCPLQGHFPDERTRTRNGACVTKLSYLHILVV